MGTLIIRNHGSFHTGRNLCPQVGGDIHGSIVHCIGCDGGMYGGFALHIPDYHKEEYRKNNHEWEGKGFCSVTLGANEHYYHLVTKEETEGKPTLQNLEEALEDFVNIARRRTCEFHMPQIGCGIDGLNWKDVLPLIDKAARRIDGTIIVYILEEFRE